MSTDPGHLLTSLSLLLRSGDLGGGGGALRGCPLCAGDGGGLLLPHGLLGLHGDDAAQRLLTEGDDLVHGGGGGSWSEVGKGE